MESERIKRKRSSQSEKQSRDKPKVAVTLSTAVTEVGVTLGTGHVIAPLCTLNVDLKREETKKRKNFFISLPPFINQLRTDAVTRLSLHCNISTKASNPRRCPLYLATWTLLRIPLPVLNDTRPSSQQLVPLPVVATLESIMPGRMTLKAPHKLAAAALDLQQQNREIWYFRDN